MPVCPSCHGVGNPIIYNTCVRCETCGGSGCIEAPPVREPSLIVPISNATDWYSHAFWCPACKTGHVINLEPTRGEPLWTLSGTPEAPTVRASVLVRSGNENGPTICHLYITDGQIQYLSDCTHQLAGKTVPMESL